MDIKPVLYDLTCTQCGVRFSMMSPTGPSNICDECAGILMEVLWGPDFRSVKN